MRTTQGLQAVGLGADLIQVGEKEHRLHLGPHLLLAKSSPQRQNRYRGIKTCRWLPTPCSPINWVLLRSTLVPQKLVSWEPNLKKKNQLVFLYRERFLVLLFTKRPFLTFFCVCTTSLEKCLVLASSTLLFFFPQKSVLISLPKKKRDVQIFMLFTSMREEGL